jgi:hypothetical protein
VRQTPFIYPSGAARLQQCTTLLLLLLLLLP